MVRVVTNAKEVSLELTQFTEDIVKQLSINTTANLVQTTPRDTSWARSNWVPNIGQSFGGTSGTREQAEEGNISTAEQQSGIAEVALAYKLSKGPVFITNNVPYILALNDGSSVQAPAGFVQIAIIEAVREVNSKGVFE